MTDLVFVPGDGSEVVSPDADWLREVVLHGGADFWCSGSGQGWLKRADGASLLLAFAPGHGFFPEYVGDEQDRWMALSRERGTQKVPIWIGGDPIIVSEQFFVSPELARAAVEELCASGKRTARFPWVRQNDVPWSFGYWDHPDVKIG